MLKKTNFNRKWVPCVNSVLIFVKEIAFTKSMQKFSDEPVKRTDEHEKVNLRDTEISLAKTINPAKKKFFVQETAGGQGFKFSHFQGIQKPVNNPKRFLSYFY